MCSAQPSAAPGSRRPRRKPGENRAVLLEAGTIEFGLRGFAAAQTSAIARRAGVSQPNVYANFASKQELFLACLRTVADREGAGQHTLLTQAAVHDSDENHTPAAATQANVPREDQTDTARRPISDADAMLVFQAVACAASVGTFGSDVRTLIAQVQRQLGSDGFERTLVQAARLLLTVS